MAVVVAMVAVVLAVIHAQQNTKNAKFVRFLLAFPDVVVGVFVVAISVVIDELIVIDAVLVVVNVVAVVVIVVQVVVVVVLVTSWISPKCDVFRLGLLFRLPSLFSIFRRPSFSLILSSI